MVRPAKGKGFCTAHTNVPGIGAKVAELMTGAGAKAIVADVLDEAGLAFPCRDTVSCPTLYYAVGINLNRGARFIKMRSILGTSTKVSFIILLSVLLSACVNQINKKSLMNIDRIMNQGNCDLARTEATRIAGRKTGIEFFILGKISENCEKNLRKAIRLYEISARNGFKPAIVALRKARISARNTTYNKPAKKSTTGWSALSRSDVKRAQKALNDLGFKVGAVDGVPGKRTNSALETFQRIKGLPIGPPDSATLRALEACGSSCIREGRAPRVASKTRPVKPVRNYAESQSRSRHRQRQEACRKELTEIHARQAADVAEYKRNNPFRNFAGLGIGSLAQYGVNQQNQMARNRAAELEAHRMKCGGQARPQSRVVQRRTVKRAQPAKPEGIFVREFESGMSTICVYDDLGSEVFLTIKDGFCPL
jgi:hypothetical protein